MGELGAAAPVSAAPRTRVDGDTGTNNPRARARTVDWPDFRAIRRIGRRRSSEHTRCTGGPRFVAHPRGKGSSMFGLRRRFLYRLVLCVAVCVVSLLAAGAARATDDRK